MLAGAPMCTAPDLQPYTAKRHPNLYGNVKTLPKWRTQEWHLADAARASSQPAQKQMQGRTAGCRCASFSWHTAGQAWFERCSAHLFHFVNAEEVEEVGIRTLGARTRAVRS